MCSLANTGGAEALRPALIVSWPFDPSTVADELIQLAGPLHDELHMSSPQTFSRG